MPHRLCGYVCLSEYYLFFFFFEYYFYYILKDQKEREYGIKGIENAVFPCLGVEGGKDQKNR